jgi:uncharacterized membrane protein YeaQ/YmgE (transglycosylase-associated protein family)
MPQLTIVFAAALILLGLVGYFGTGTGSPTALIPAVFGAVLLVCGLAALRGKWRQHAMHVASASALLGFVGAVVGLILRANQAGATAIASQALMAALCGVYFGLCLKSFLDARARRSE